MGYFPVKTAFFISFIRFPVCFTIVLFPPQRYYNIVI